MANNVNGISGPRLNHIALTVSPDELDVPSRAELLDFYGAVFGWTEMPTTTRDRELLILRAGSNEQFVFLHSSADPMRCNGQEHFGLSVDTLDAFSRIRQQARARADLDPRIELTDEQVEDFGVLRLHSFYLRFRLPIWVELQHFEWAAGHDSASGSEPQPGPK